MNQFTRSLLYSTAVIALGLGAVIAIYSESQNNLAAIEPAAGVEASAIAGEASPIDQTTFQSTLPADADIDALVENVDENAKDILAEIEDIISAVELEEATGDLEEIAPAAGDDHHGDDEHGDDEHGGDHH